MNFLEMLLLTRKMTFVDGKITLYGQDLIIYPPQAMAAYIPVINDEPELVKELYLASKQAMLENKEGLVKAYAGSEMGNWICSTINLYGIGKMSYEDSATAPSGAVILENSAIIEELKEKVNAPVDHIPRGILAGVASAISDKDFDAIEVECAFGDKSGKCKIIVDSKENLQKNFPEIYSKQVK